MKRVLVTGGSGFLGSHVVKSLSRAGYDVVICDLQPPVINCDFIHADLTSLDDMVQATKGVDYVCHLGAVGDVYLAFDKPYLAAKTNVTGTANLMEACLRNHVQRVIYASTWEVYGKPHYQPIDEEHPCEPEHPYSITKLAGEQTALAYDRLKGVPTVALRLGTAYGTGMRANSVFSIFITRALAQQPLKVEGSGTQFRQFTHVRDTGRAFVQALQSPVRAAKLNVVVDEGISIKQLAEMVAEQLPVPVVFEKARLGDVPSARISPKKAREVLNWTPQVTFGEGLSELIEWYRNNRVDASYE